MNKTAKTIIGIGGIVGALLATSPAGAQTGAQCNGLDATIVQTNYVPELLGTDGDDVIVITYATNTNEAGTLVDALGGNDTVCVVGTPTGNHNEFGFDSLIIGGDGDDTIIGGVGDDAILGDLLFNDTTGGNDTLHGGIGDDAFNGGPGDDQLFGEQGEDSIGGGSGNDAVHGGIGDDFMGGEDGNDEVFGGPGHDIVYGNEGKDVIFGGAGNDMLFSNNDLFGQISDTPLDGPLGILTGSSGPEDISGSRMFGGAGDDVLIGSNRWDRMQGGDGNDVLAGFEGRDWMRGGAGSDIILGGTGIDDINGNLGGDQIVIVGADTGLGGFGNDTCIFGPGSNDAQLRSCEASDTAGPEWNDISNRLPR